MVHFGLTSIRRSVVALLLLNARTATGQGAAEPTRALLRSGMLSFSAHATVGDFIGSTSTVMGAVTGDLPQARGWVEAPVATIVTHNDHRDRDLRASMEVDKYATMRFDLDGVAPDSSGAPAHVLLHGRLTLHGVTRAVALPATLQRAGDTIHVASSFPLLLGEYQIGGLRKMLGLLRMDPRIEVHVDLHFVITESFNP